MKIEKVNDNQIRCTMTREDLETRQLKISEIAYGTEKAKLLFRDVMQQASYEYGFETEDIPLMIEAIPMSSGCIVFIITKVEDPEELDTRFSKFAPSVHEDDEEDEYYPEAGSVLEETLDELLDHLPETPDDVFDLFRKISSKKTNVPDAQPALPQKQGKEQGRTDLPAAKNVAVAPVKLFSFDHLDTLTDVAKILSGCYAGGSILYKNTSNSRYYLLLRKEEYSDKEFIKTCNLLMEYGKPENCTPAGIAYMEEHYSVILGDHAIAALAKI